MFLTSTTTIPKPSSASIPGTTSANSSTSGIVTAPSSSPDTPTAGTLSEKIGDGRVPKRAALIGGLTGAMGGLVLIGLLLFLLLRRRRPHDFPRSHSPHSSNLFASYLSPDPNASYSWNSKAAPQLPPVRIFTLPVIDDNVIRISLDHWERPFARTESLRDSKGLVELRVTNPDPTRPSTPRVPTASSARFLQRQISSFAAWTNALRSASQTTLPQHEPMGGSSPATDRRLSRELRVASGAPTPRPTSVWSKTSTISTRVLRQKPPEDPFLGPGPVRPVLSTLQPVASRSNSNWTTFRLKSSGEASRSTSASSVPRSERRATGTTWKTTTTTTSDPFYLDREGSYRNERGQTPNWTVHAYEGT